MRFLLFFLLASRASAIDIDHEEYQIIGWDDGCSVAVERYGYPRLGEAIRTEPITSRIGTIYILAEWKTKSITRWVFEADGTHTYDKHAIDRFRKVLRKKGHDRPGFAETIRNSPTIDSPGSAEVIFSTAILEARPDFWPDTRDWRLANIHYNPLSTCALMIYEKIGERPRFKFLLTRIFNASARSERGRAHTVNGRLLFNNGDLVDALAETEIGAKMAPELAATRYNYAGMLSLSGRLEASLRELLAAIKIDEDYRDKARDDLDFDPLRKRQDFQELVLKKKRAAPMPAPN